MDRIRLNFKILGAAIIGAVLGSTLVALSLSYRPFFGPSDPSQEYPTLLIGVTGLAVAVVAYVIAKLHFRKQSWM
ncbi:MAG: hypothetical protein AM326_12010 [Candidatus Thorarchaeota archaeon SMTZ-45]|nr:MAG: hypothetical protein AM326_12010 [Candidatus Thorarchaeota archaeon SMTZ-45]KXH73044.1 MAG: hypothetical protein AM325_08365 [Candidatus Thorarchaeota archaeon SMTZ1-45]